jgi:hypothetical protein
VTARYQAAGIVEVTVPVHELADTRKIPSTSPTGHEGQREEPRLRCTSHVSAVTPPSDRSPSGWFLRDAGPRFIVAIELDVILTLAASMTLAAVRGGTGVARDAEHERVPDVPVRCAARTGGPEGPG